MIPQHHVVSLFFFQASFMLVILKYYLKEKEKYSLKMNYKHATIFPGFSIVDSGVMAPRF